MLYKISIETDHLRAELFNRETVDETREFFEAVVSSALKNQCLRILISVRSSNPVFTVEKSGFFGHFKKISGDSSHKIALMGDSEELGISHQYLELLGRQHGINVQTFRDETAALRWFRMRDSPAGASAST